MYNVQATFSGHNAEILDVFFNLTGTKIASASSDRTARDYDVKTLKTDFILEGHEAEISRTALIREETL